MEINTAKPLSQRMKKFQVISVSGLTISSKFDYRLQVYVSSKEYFSYIILEALATNIDTLMKKLSSIYYHAGKGNIFFITECLRL